MTSASILFFIKVYFTHNILYVLEKEMATHFSILAWEISSKEEPGGVQSMRLQKNRTWLSN